MKSPSVRDCAARLAVSAGALLPYLPALTLTNLFVTDDVFTSDIYNGELPARVLIARTIAAGQAPVWSSKLCSGFPIAAGGVLEPLSTGLFATLETAPALCLLVICIVLLAAHGAYSLARRIGAQRSGAVLAGIAFAGSGYLVTQLKHLAISMTVAWLPWGLLLLDRALAASRPTPMVTGEHVPPLPSNAARLRDIGLFGLIFAEQVVCGFPQSAYISGLIYGVWALALLLKLRGRVGRLPLAVVVGASLALVVALGSMCGSPMLLPLAELGKYSDRHGRLAWDFASMAPYAWTDLLNFVIPYANGDIADSTYRGEGIFWENYGYVGLATIVLAAFAVLRHARRPRVLLLLGIAVSCMALVLGKHTPVFHFAWQYLPGMAQFRFPTRFLVVVDLAIALLGAVGMTSLCATCSRLFDVRAPRLPSVIAAGITIGTALDLFANQSHQNPFVPASEWLGTPAAVKMLGKEAPRARFFAPLHNDWHMQAFRLARGWANLDPYRLLRATVAPNTGVYWNVPTVDCYAGIAPSWFVDVWGDHSRYGFVVPPLMRVQENVMATSSSYATVLSTFGVTHALSPVPVVNAQLREVPNTDGVHMYEVGGQRVRIVPEARKVDSNREAASFLLRPDFDPDALVLLHRRKRDTALQHSPASAGVGQAQIAAEDSRHVRVDVDAPQGGYLVLADTYYPGWHASVDGTPATLYRADIMLRAVWLPAGAKKVEFTYDAAPFFLGLKLACAGFALLIAWVAAFTMLQRRTSVA